MQKSRFALNKLELIFVNSEKNKEIVNEVIEETNKIGLKYNTEMSYKFETSNDDKVQMKMYNYLTKNEHEFFD